MSLTQVKGNVEDRARNAPTKIKKPDETVTCKGEDYAKAPESANDGGIPDAAGALVRGQAF